MTGILIKVIFIKSMGMGHSCHFGKG